VFGNQANEGYVPEWDTYKNNSSVKSVTA
jgi:hypothetical protein